MCALLQKKCGPAKPIVFCGGGGSDMGILQRWQMLGIKMLVQQNKKTVLNCLILQVSQFILLLL